jgi:hypothetical protein
VRSYHWDADKRARIAWMVVMNMVDELRLSEVKEDGGSCARFTRLSSLGFEGTHHVRWCWSSAMEQICSDYP